MVFAPVYGCPFMREGDVRRDAKMADFENLVRLVAGVRRARLARRHDLRARRPPARLAPPRHGVRAADAVRQAVHGLGHLRARTRPTRSAMGEILFGGREAIERAPVVDLADQRQLAAALRRPHARRRCSSTCRAGQAVVITPFLLMGAMSPVSLPATLVQQMAEALAGIALAQLIRPGCPVVFGSFLSNTDMQSGSPIVRHARVGDRPALHRPDRAPLRPAVARRRRPERLSQTVDAQAAYEALMTMLPTFLAGTNFVMHSAGWLEGGPRLLLREVHRRHRAPARAAARVHAARDRRGVARLRRARRGRRRRPLPRRGAHARALPRVLLPAAAVLDRELRALDASAARATRPRAPARSGARRSRATSSRRSTTPCAPSSRST